MSNPDRVVVVLCAAWLLAVALITINGTSDLLMAIADAGTAVWVQSIGTIAALFAAIGAAYFQGWIAKRDRYRERVERAYRVASASGLRISMYVQLAHTNLKGSGPHLIGECERIESGLRAAIEMFEVQAIPDMEDETSINAAMSLVEVGRTTLVNVQTSREPISRGFEVPTGRFLAEALRAIDLANILRDAKRKALPWLYQTR